MQAARKTQTAAMARTLRRPSSKSIPGPKQGSCRSVLDSAAVRSVIQKVLKSSRFRITADEADGHAAAVSQVRRHAFDVVILDCHMSGKDGFETLAELRKIRPDAKILMTTERQDPTLADQARREGAAEFLTKPFFSRDIDTAFSRVFRLGHLRWN